MPPSPPPQRLPEPERPGKKPEANQEVRPAVPVAVPIAKPITAPPARPYCPTKRPSVALLTVLDDGKTGGEVLRLRADRFVIGRAEGDFLVPHDPQISTRHVEISRQRVADKVRWIVTDLQSSNGLFIRVSRTALANKAEFLVGLGRYRFDAPGAAMPETVDAPTSDAPHGETRPFGMDAASLLQPALVELVGGTVLSRLPLAQPEYWIGTDPTCAVCRTMDGLRP
ncbi:MAG TPA: FHA domain-containing protein [Gemmataceae bacterium]|nr:FHA domain-containing protein [Gemmataceae bacterium]